mmetsp:Transcript_10260/g.15282  ORF Transcript_10260/g.15282 Transcript_10260/m.15282 type:complete len:158 (+) Transcript_10260:220-693(+)|eukprot:CAMPEP_0196805774 /NCGR_PEP_ID=MMETSP1362-20130617/5597_1 /TAXON_ID=163516 /ORGANISM="Leptocylindrus danicus, Strain CCMP1856" /LENGTH=157 /DNA_ID=CAMNT_0042178903 /DNA_START=194 /DNA_END=667 /DNA_ORIENTATION=-
MRQVIIVHSLACLFLAAIVEPFMNGLTMWVPVKKKQICPEAQKKVFTPEENAEFLSEYMVISHEAKLRAVGDATAKANEKIKALEAENEKLKAQLEEMQLGPVPAPDGGGRIFEMPATNKALAEKFSAAQAFMADYLVKASIEKYNAVRAAEQKLIE